MRIGPNDPADQWSARTNRELGTVFVITRQQSHWSYRLGMEIAHKLVYVIGN